MRRQEQLLSVIALVLLAGVITYHVLSSPLTYEVTVEEGVTTETVVATTTVSLSVTEAQTKAAVEASEPSTAPSASVPGIDSSGRVNLNTASLEDLKTLNGIGDSKAQAIIDDRTENGPFSTVEDLTRVSGIGQKTFENLKDQITV